MSDNITREPYRNAWYKQLADAVKKHDEEIAEMTPHLVPEVEEGDNGKILIAGEDGAFDWGQPPEELPIITEGDEGKVLKVDEGVPKWLEDTDSEYLLVTISRTGSSPNWTYVADKTYAQIRPFAEAGKCILKYSRTNIFFVLHAVTPTSIMFMHPTEFHYDAIVDSPLDSRAGYGRVEGVTITADSISFSDNFMYFDYGFSISNGETISEKNYNSLKAINDYITTVVECEYNSKKVNLTLSSRNSANTEFDFVNYEEGIKAHIDANRLVTITEIPKLPTATSADEGKVVGVDSNGDYSLLSNYTYDFSTSEIKVGKWIDGKDVYKRTWEFATELPISANSWGYTDIPTTGIERVIDIITGNDSGSMFRTVGVNWIGTPDNKIGIFNDRSLHMNVKYLTLYYVKSTTP